jgi:quercetin dioxygenase-like cupin family protein
MQTPQVHVWQAVAKEALNPKMARKVVHTARMSIARLEIQKDGVVPEHQHENEQVSMVESGALLFKFPHGEMTVVGGESMEIPPNLPHSVVALEDTVVLDLFAPRREDWIRGDDAYLRR